MTRIKLAMSKHQPLAKSSWMSSDWSIDTFVLYCLVSLRDTFLALMEWSVSPPCLLPYMVICSRVGTGRVSGPAYSCGYICTQYMGRSCSHTLWGAAKKVDALKWGLCQRWRPELTFAAYNSSTFSLMINDTCISSITLLLEYCTNTQ